MFFMVLRLFASEGNEPGWPGCLTQVWEWENKPDLNSRPTGRPARGKSQRVTIDFGMGRFWSDLIIRLEVRQPLKLSFSARILGVWNRARFCNDLIRAHTIIPNELICYFGRGGCPLHHISVIIRSPTKFSLNGTRLFMTSLFSFWAHFCSRLVHWDIHTVWCSWSDQEKPTFSKVWFPFAVWK